MSHDPIVTAYQTHIALPGGLDSKLRAALQHTLAHPGNLVRARLAYSTGRCYGVAAETSLRLAMAVEYFHTASLLFDDLPCMDDAQERRGNACTHVAHGEASAILSALALINHAYAQVWEALADVPKPMRQTAGRYVEQCLGVAGLLNGQSHDLNSAGAPRNPALTQEIAIGKTVSLIRLSLVLPAMVGGAGAFERQLLERLAMFWGLSYQILDDLKDVHAETLSTGKTGARDAALNRPNLALAIGAREALGRTQRLLGLADRTLVSLLHRAPGMEFLEGIRSRFQRELAEFQSLNQAPAT